MKEKILSQLKEALTANGGKTSISEKTFAAYAELASKQITDEAAIAEGIKPFVETLKEFQQNINAIAAQSVTEKEAALKADYEKQIAALKGNPPKVTGELTGELTIEKINEILEAKFSTLITPISQKMVDYEAKEKAAARQSAIISKAKELGISELRIGEGFVIADDADDASVNTYLSKIAQNEVSRGLESSKNGLFPLATQVDQAKADAKSFAESLPNK
ncbi:hypothetical protein AGMMS49525_04760 [Bacteroidia bacterium]|nr:hypothetical protein AGMMS49525_04760 [Bacteroidia bacterium]